MFNDRVVICVLFFLFFQLQTMLPLTCNGNWLNDAFIDPSDGKLHMSNRLLDRDGLLPVPIIITEPAIGYGGGMALVYFHDKVGSRKGSPPSVSAIAGAATENGTWFAGAVGGRLKGRRSAQQAANQAEQKGQSKQQGTQEQINNFKKAFSVCLEGKGYLVKY